MFTFYYNILVRESSNEFQAEDLKRLSKLVGILDGCTQPSIHILTKFTMQLVYSMVLLCNYVVFI